MRRKLELTKKQAVKDCKELWKLIEDSGLTKDEFLQTEIGRNWQRNHYYDTDCPLCHYTNQFPDNTCARCPLKKKYDKDCVDLGFHPNGHSKRFPKAVRGL